MAGNPRQNQCGKQLGNLINTLSHDAPLLRCSFYNPDGQKLQDRIDYPGHTPGNCTGTV
jgi:hypothetical protein